MSWLPWTFWRKVHPVFPVLSLARFLKRQVEGQFEMVVKKSIKAISILQLTVQFSEARHVPLNDPETKRRVAIHESGHALIAAITKPGSVRKATIIPRGQALGYVAPIQKELHLSTLVNCWTK